MTSRYTHLQPEDLLTLASLAQQGLSKQSIARLLERMSNTVCHELARNGSVVDGFVFTPTQAATSSSRRSTAARPQPLEPERASMNVAQAGKSHLVGYRAGGTLTTVASTDPRRPRVAPAKLRLSEKLCQIFCPKYVKPSSVACLQFFIVD